MKNLLMLSVIIALTGTTPLLSNTNQIKPSTNITANTTAAAIKLAEAKASLSKANTRSSKTTLGTADGGI